MRILLQKHTFMYVIMAGIFCAIVAMIGVTLASHAQAASNEPVATGKHLITLHDNGQDRGILTSASTLRAAFKEAKITVDPNDLVEPGLDDTLVASQYEVNIYRARPITIVDGAVRQKVLSPYQTARQVATHAGMVLHDEDTTTLLANSDIVTEGAGLKLTVTRATPFTFVLYGKSVQAYTQAKTVGEMLKQKNVTIQSADTLSVAATTPITTGMSVELWRNGKQVITEDQAIAFPVDQTKDADQPVGYKKVTTPGVDGKKTVSYEVEMKNGVEVSRTEIQSVTTLEPVHQVEIIGAKATNTFTGDFAGALARLRSCEGSYTSNTGNGYYGAYQYDIRTWGNYAGFANASLAPAAVQDEKAWITYQARGWQPWPSCKVKMGLQDIYR